MSFYLIAGRDSIMEKIGPKVHTCFAGAGSKPAHKGNRRAAENEEDILLFHLCPLSSLGFITSSGTTIATF